MTDENVLQALRELAARLGKSNLTVEEVEQHLPFTRETLLRRWGTSRAAFEAAGLSATNLGRRYNDAECFDNLLAVWTHYGRPPTYREMGLPPSQVGSKAYITRFQSWNKALAVFVERVNQDSGQEEERRVEADTVLIGEFVQLQPPSPRSSEEARDIKLGLRFRILHRDRFKCVLCGDHPARNAECVLNIDHIIPWSKGGKTSEENLRTLCGTCNVGRGNRFVD